MTKMRVTVTVCDVCGTEGKPAERYTIHYPHGGAHRIDLCADDAAPLEHLRGYGSDVGSHLNEQVFTPEEIAAKRRPRKRG